MTIVPDYKKEALVAQFSRTDKFLYIAWFYIGMNAHYIAIPDIAVIVWGHTTIEKANSSNHQQSK